MAKKHTITVTLNVGKKLLGRTRIDVGDGDTTEVSGVLMGDDAKASPLATVCLLYAAHLFAPNKEIEAALSDVIHIMDPKAELGFNQGHAQVKRPLPGSDWDIPF